MVHCVSPVKPESRLSKIDECEIEKLLYVNAAVSVAEGSCRALGAACGGVAVADKAALSDINGLALRTTDHLSGMQHPALDGVYKPMHHS